MTIFRTLTWKFIATALLVIGTSAARSADAGLPLVFHAHDDPNLDTYAFDMDSRRNVVGYYYDADFNATAFIRTADGRYTDLRYDAPGTESTFGKAINERGIVIGNANVAGWNQGWSYDTNTGVFSPIQVPGARATFAEDITESGVVVGFAAFYEQIRRQYIYKGFVLRGGRYRLIDVPGATATYIRATNENGDLAGLYNDAANVGHSYILKADGTLVTVDAVNAYGRQMTLYALTRDGQATGTCSDAVFATQGCFYDAATGNVALFSLPGMATTNPWSLKGGVVVGFAASAEGVNSGFVGMRSQLAP